MKIKKLLISLVLVAALPGFAAESTDTNLVEVVNFEDLAKFFSDLSSVVSNLQDVVYQTSVSGAVTSSNLISDVSAKLTTLQTALTAASGKPSNINVPSIQIRNGNASVVATSWQWRDIGFAFNNITQAMNNMMQYFSYFVSGQNSIQNYSKYNFSRLYDIIDSFCDNVLPLITSIDNHLAQIESDVGTINSNVESIKSDLSIVSGYVQDLYNFLTAQLAGILDTLHTGTNQLQTIIYIIEGLTNRVDNTATNYYGDITNVLHEIASGVSSIDSAIGDGWEPGGGGFPGGGSTNSVELSYFDKWLKEWVDKYFYPADSSNVFQLRYGQLTYREQFMEGVMNFRVPFFYPGPLPTDTYRAIPFDDPKWEHSFFNTLEAYNSGHTNYYDIVSALLTDIQSVNAQNYALFYVLATNILLQSADADVSETQRDVDSLQEKIDSYQSDVETMKTDLEYKFNSLKNKYEDIKEKSDQIFSYLGGLARLPQQDYYFDLPKLQLGEDLEFGGMEITLPLTNESLVMVAEILRFFSICLYWGLFISMLYYAARGVVKMFLLLFKFMIYMGAIGTDK